MLIPGFWQAGFLLLKTKNRCLILLAYTKIYISSPV